MPEDDRTFEVDVHGVHQMKLQPRTAGRRKNRSARRASADQAETSPAHEGYSSSREIILRLIEWLRNECP